jgi:pimeloyl-ACP methyl ester carboxylesterase
MAVTTGTAVARLTAEDRPIEAEPRLVVLLHGAFLNPALWHDYAAALGDAYRVIAPAYTESGWGSGGGPDAPDVGEAADYVAAEIEAAGGHALVLGHSLGGYVALHLAATRPQLVDGLILLGCSTPPHGFATLLDLHLRALERIPASISSFVLGLMVQWYDPEVWRRLQSVGISMHRGARAVRSLRSFDYWRLVRAVRCPVLVVNGSRDWLFRSSAWHTAGAARRGNVAQIPAAGHLAPVDRRDEICDVIREFATEIDRA